MTEPVPSTVWTILCSQHTVQYGPYGPSLVTMPERGQERPGQVPTLPRWPAQGQETGNWLVSGSEAGKTHATYYQVVPIISTLIGVRQAIRMKLFHVSSVVLS